MAAIERHWQRLNLISLLLLPVSLLFCALVQLRRALYRLGWLATVRLPVPVVVVGNITVGGTGKTPFVIWLAQWLGKQGYRPGIVTRGYRGQATSWPQMVTPDSDAHLVGDEAVLLAKRSGCPVVAGPDRVVDSRVLLKQGCNVIVSDDGLQHYRLGRDVEIAVIDGARRFGNGLCLPAGPLREPRGRLKKVPLRVTNGKAQAGEIGMALVPERIYSLREPQRSVSREEFGASTVHAVAGIGNPGRFFDSLRAMGLNVVAHAFPDHYAFQPGDIRFNDDRPVILTEKDAVKCSGFAGPEHWVLAVTAEVEPEFGTRVLQMIEEKRRGQETA